jgi:DNA-binding NarL/FixJ family response regulator
VRAVIAEDQPLLRQGLALVVQSAGFEVAATHRPDLVVTDIRMPPTFTDEGLVAALAISRSRPETAILVLSQFVQRRYAMELVGSRSGGVGYLLKQRFADIDTFAADLHRIVAGETVLDPQVVDRLMDRGRAGAPGLDQLTTRQREVLSLMAAGRSNASIARALVISEKAVVQHISRMYSLLGLPPSADDHRRVIAVLRHLSR